MVLRHSAATIRSRIIIVMSVWILVFAMLFGIFVVHHQNSVDADAAGRIENHARVVASSLWTFDRTGPLAYLQLAMEANGYLDLVVYDESGSAFLSLAGTPLSNLETLLVSIHLIPLHHLSNDIVYEGAAIGRIAATWPNRAVYLYLNLFFWIVLVLVGIGLLLKLFEAKRSLESRVQERTAALEKEITERTKTEEALRAQTQRLSLHVMDTPLGVIEWNGNFQVREWNKAAERIFGYSRDEAIGMHGLELIPTDEQKTSIEAVWKQLVSNTGGSRSINENLAKDGSIKTCEWYNTTLTDRDGKIVGVASLVLDITERKRAEQENEQLQIQLLQAQKMEAVGNLAGGIAHDFNNILQTISGNISLLQINHPQQDQDRERMLAIEKSVKRAADLVRQLLTFSRKIDSTLVPLDLNQEIIQIMGLLEHTIPKMITIDLQLDKQLSKINGDSVQIEQVLLNLAINAMHAMPHGGTIRIRTKNVTLNDEFCRRHLGATAGPHIQFEMTDTGVGIEEHLVNHIFEPFFTTKAIGQGSGLGLSMVYGIVKNHHGFIECHSTPNSGTTFHLFFPVSNEEATEPEHQPEITEIQGGTETILMIDDEEAIRDLGREILASYGYTVYCAGSGEEGLNLYTHDGPTSFDLVILDLNMPGMGGFKCLQRLRQFDAAVPVIIASGYTPAEVVKQVLDAGANDVIAKPFELFDLLKTIRRIIDARHSS